jgi:hypothetical protein
MDNQPMMTNDVQATDVERHIMYQRALAALRSQRQSNGELESVAESLRRIAGQDET